MLFWNYFSAGFCISGVFFFIAGTAGLIRFPDVYSRLHALTKADNVGLGLIVVGVLPHTVDIFQVIKILLIWALILFASATSCHLIARHEYHKRPGVCQGGAGNNE